MLPSCNIWGRTCQHVIATTHCTNPMMWSLITASYQLLVFHSLLHEHWSWPLCCGPLHPTIIFIPLFSTYTFHLYGANWTRKILNVRIEIFGAEHNVELQHGSMVFTRTWARTPIIYFNKICVIFSQSFRIASLDQVLKRSYRTRIIVMKL